MRKGSQPLLSSPAALASPTVQLLLQNRSNIAGPARHRPRQYLDNHPTSWNLESQLKNTNDQLVQAATQARNAVRTDLVSAQTTASQLKREVSTWKARRWKSRIARCVTTPSPAKRTPIARSTTDSCNDTASSTRRPALPPATYRWSIQAQISDQPSSPIRC